MLEQSVQLTTLETTVNNVDKLTQKLAALLEQKENVITL